MLYSKELCVTVSAASLVLSSLAVATRFWARHLVRARLTVDDWLILIALLFCQATSSTVIMMAEIGRLAQYQTIDANGRQVLDNALIIHRKGEYLVQISSIICMTLCKLSVLFFYRRIFAFSRLTTVTNIFIGIIILWGVSFSLSSMFECVPVSRIWMSLGAEGLGGSHCLKLIPFFNTVTISDAVTDVAIMILPLPILWRLKVSIRQKVGIMGVFVVGAGVVTVSLARAVVFIAINHNIHEHYRDWTYYTTGIFLVTEAECALAVICASLPAMRPLLDHPFRRVEAPSIQEIPLKGQQTSFMRVGDSQEA